ncbi:MAG: RNA methyltransferase [Oscillatoriaceae bacterium SKW80]|nr:RNA methyltransferase [Oscillatoriaceae bacterium SKYG93]MCX8122249.1 RNA methyltransferase [Oscillatoriaceae bacterium SKW80]MDW8454535.1 RNA methyltransferase [Oscillatoriaceae cyanobacterium SKYGB_i_bin93]HIK29397.1 RNA methyltransferase [Oscillatoriaceae cyanobacterium M7585_C2015_266]
MSLGDNVRVVLVEPAGALNVGAVARVMKNMELRQLILVNPQCDPLGEDARKMAVHAVDILETALTVDTLPQALQNCQRAIATTGRACSKNFQIEHPRTALPWLLEAPSALIFGPEARGLNKEELNYAQRFIRIPASSAYCSLNLAQAAAICFYELYQAAIGAYSPDNLQHSQTTAEKSAFPPPPLPAASIEALERYYQHLQDVLLQIGYLYPHTVASRMEKFRRIFNRAQLSTSEVAMLQGILSQIEWLASEHQKVNDILKASPDISKQGTSD